MTPSETQRPLWLWSLIAIAIGVTIYGATQIMPMQAQNTPQRPIHRPPVIEPPIIMPPPRPIPQPQLGQELRLLNQKAQVTIDGAVARTKLEQTFQNPTNRTIEGTYLFPLPSGAAISNFAMTVNGKRIAAEILEADKAREIYTGIVQKMRDPAILEFIDRNLVKARIFPIAPNDTPKIELEYSEALTPQSGDGAGGSFRYVLPLRLPVGGTAQSSSVDIKLNESNGLRAVYSPTHEIDTSRDGDRAHISGEWKAGQSSDDNAEKSAANRDFVLYFSTARSRVGVSAVSYQEAGDDGYFMMMVAPDPNLSDREIAAKDVIFVCDTSGSMEGDKIGQARRALSTLLGNLNARDRFGIITFASDTRTFRDEMKTAAPDNLQAAKKWIEDIKAVGGTNINDALLDALKMLGKPEGNRARQIVFLTDGQPTVGETDVAQILKNVRAKNAGVEADTSTPGVWTKDSEMPQARLFVFGVGYDVNTRLLDTLAEDNRGSSDYVLPKEDIEAKVGSLYAKIAYPVLSNPRLDWGGLQVHDVYPRRLPDLFRGTQAVVFGRYEGTAPRAQVQLIGTSNGREERIGGDGNFAGNDNNDLLPRLWAMRKIGYLVEDARDNKRPMSEEVRAEIIKLSKKYGIVTPVTAALITEDDAPVLAAGRSGARTYANPLAGMEAYAGYGGSVAADQAHGGGYGGAARAKTSAGVSAAMPAADSGAAAVVASQARREMREADRVKSDANVRYIEGKAFYQRDGVWVDGAFDKAKAKPEVIEFGSAEYLKLLNDKTVAKWLSVGDRVIIVLPNRVIEVK